MTEIRWTEAASLWAAGDALAEACAVLLEDAAESTERETTGMKRAYPALAAWAAVRSRPAAGAGEPYVLESAGLQVNVKAPKPSPEAPDAP